ncbi:nucleotide-binding protein [Clostridium sp. YIM B02555]|uniref:TIR domain-containing protein n=1 Tax=Clostridium sp. YIM B02555 TaxID=2911968 RepID=UPI001EED4DDB|nr:nucleotide-binding protein [Clostridium sp. YIM B02555]
MKKYKGSFEQLKQIVESTGINGQWDSANFGYKFTSDDGAILNWYNTTGTINYQGKAIPKEILINELSKVKPSSFSSKIQISTNPINIKNSEHIVPHEIEKQTRIFIVHGHDTNSRTELELFLTKLGLESFVLQNSSGGGQTIIEVLESEIGKQSTYQQFGIVLLTPDDEGYSIKEGDVAKRKRARQNAVLEMGMLISALGRKKVAILKKGDLEVPSDADGLLYIPYVNSINEVRNKILQRLNESGIKIESEKLINALY